MTNTQLWLAIAFPSLIFLAGIVLNWKNFDTLRKEFSDVRGEIKDVRGEIKDVRGEIKDVRGEIANLRSELLARLDRVDADLRTFYGITGALQGRLDELSKR